MPTKVWIALGLCVLYAVGIYIFADKLFQAASVDLGWHWALIDFIRENGHAPRVYSPMLRVMSDYPPVSHALGAALSIFVGSGLIGMHILALSAIAIVYAVVADELPVIGSIIFAQGALEIGRRRLLIGHEVVDNYFFAQFVATALAVATLALVLRIRDRRWQAASAVAVTLSLGWVFPAIAVVFGVSIGFIWLCGLVRELRAGKLPSLRMVVALGALAISLILAIIASPYFLGMISNASHDGTIQSWASPRLVGLLGLAVACAALWVASSSKPPSLVIPAAAGGFGLVACVQWLALLLGFGSPYAVLKLGFGVGTFGLALAALTVTTMGAPRLTASVWRPLMAIPILAAVFYASRTVTPARDLDGLRNYAASVRKVSDQFPELRNTTISANQDFDGALNWSVSLVALAAEYGVGVDQLGAFGFPLRPDERSPGARFAALPTQQAKGLPDACFVHRTEIVTIVKLECKMKVVPTPLQF